MPFDGVEYVSNQSLQKIDTVINLLATPDRWCKGALRSHDGRYCIRGAVRAIDAADALEPPILRAIGEVTGRRFRRIESFNDHPNTSHDEVLAVLLRARETIRAGASAPPAPVRQRRCSVIAAWRAGVAGWLTG